MRGLKQGNPLSHLFIITEEVLRIGIYSDLSSRNLILFKVPRYRCCFSHILFADDILIKQVLLCIPMHVLACLHPQNKF